MPRHRNIPVFENSDFRLRLHLACGLMHRDLIRGRLPIRIEKPHVDAVARLSLQHGIPDNGKTSIRQGGDMRVVLTFEGRGIDPSFRPDRRAIDKTLEIDAVPRTILIPGFPDNDYGIFRQRDN